MGTYINKYKAAIGTFSGPDSNLVITNILFDAAQRYPVHLKQIILYARYESFLSYTFIWTYAHTEFRDLIEANIGSDKTLDDVEPGPKATNRSNQLRLEAQIIQNSNFYLDNVNTRLRTQKRKLDEHAQDYAVLNWISNEKEEGIKVFLSRYF